MDPDPDENEKDEKLMEIKQLKTEIAELALEKQIGNQRDREIRKIKFSLIKEKLKVKMAEIEQNKQMREYNQKLKELERIDEMENEAHDRLVQEMKIRKEENNIVKHMQNIREMEKKMKYLKRRNEIKKRITELMSQKKEEEEEEEEDN